MATSRGGLLTLPLLVLLLSPALARQCKPGCVGSGGGVFKYEPGTLYQYRVEGEWVTALAGADRPPQKLTLKASAAVASLPDCLFSLSLSDVQLTTADGKSYPGGEALQSKPVSFSMNGGTVSEVCASSQEDNNALNVKRAVISLLQATGVKSASSNFRTEVDVFGSCPTDIDVVKSGKVTKVKKVKNLNSCQHRQNGVFPFSTTEYSVESDLQSSLVLSGRLESTQTVESGVVKSAVSEEVYHFTPLSTFESGAKITVTTKLTLQSSSKGGQAAGDATEGKSLIFEYEDRKTKDVTSVATNLLKKVCEGSKEEIQNKNSLHYTYLILTLRQANKACLSNLVNSVKSGSVCAKKEAGKKILYDAVSQAHTAETVSLMADLLKKKEVTGTKAVLWYSSLGMVTHASRESLKSVLPLLDDSAPVEAYLGIGSLVGKYCRDHSCDKVPEVTQVQSKLAGPLSQGCKTTSSQQEDKLIASMKGLGNTNYLAPEVAAKLTACAADHSVKTRVRVAALETLRTDPDKETVKKTAVEVLKDQNEDSEVRIKAYLVLVECPCGKTAGVLKDVLEAEKSYQVGNFIVSHLRNLRASKDPRKANAAFHFANVYAPKKFPFDMRKFSHNNELSYLFETVNVGTVAESNVIFSQKSWVPRSVSLNLTANVFGQSLNLLEVTARAENIERVLERLVGPNGYMNTASVNDMESDATGLLRYFLSKAEETTRPKRGLSRAELDAFAKNVNMGVDAEDRDLTLDVSFKSHRSEIAWVRVHGEDLMSQTPNQRMDKVFGVVDELVSKAKHVDLDYTKHANLLDGMLVYPSGMGLPLKLNVMGSTAVRVKFDGKFDLPAVRRDPLNTMLKFQLVPSADVSLNALLSVDGVVVEAGVQMTANGHTSTGTDVTARLLNGKGVDVKVGLPLAKQQIFSVESNVYALTAAANSAPRVEPVKFDVKKEEYSGCFDQLTDVLGVMFCGKVSVPWDGHRTLSPAYGPSHVELSVDKEDDSLNTYHFKALYQKQDDSPQKSFELLMETPNSKKDHTLRLLFENDDFPNFHVKTLGESPWGSAHFDGKLVNTDTEHSVNLDVHFGDTDYMLKAGVKAASSGASTKYQPFLEYKVPERTSNLLGRRGGARQTPQVTVSGEVQVDKNKEQKSTDITLRGVKVNTGRVEYTVDGTVKSKPKSFNADVKVGYDSETVQVKAFSQVEEKKSEGTLKQHRGLQVLSSQYKDLSINTDFVFSTTFKGQKSAWSSEFFLVHGPDPNSQEARFTAKTSWQGVRGTTPPTFDISNSVTYPLVGLVGKLGVKSSPKEFGWDTEAAFDKYTAGSTLLAKLKDQQQYEVDFKGHAMSSNVKIYSKREAVGRYESKFTNSLEAQPGGKYQLNALVKHKFQPGDTELHVDAKATLPSEPKSLEVKGGVLDNADVYKGMAWVSAGGNVLLDSSASVNKGSNPTGTFKVSLPNHAQASGEFKLVNNVFDAKTHLHLLKPNKKVEGKAYMSMVAPKYQGHLDLCMDGKCLKANTDTHYTPDSYDTNNNVEFNNVKLNAKAKHDHATGSHTAEGQLQLPNGRQTKVTYSRNSKTAGGKLDLDVSGAIEDKEADQEPRKASAKLTAKNVDPMGSQFDGQLQLSYVTPQKKDVSFHASLKRTPSDQKASLSGEVGLSGSLVPVPLKANLDAEVSEQLLRGEVSAAEGLPVSSYRVGVNAGQHLQLESHGKASGHTVAGEVSVKAPHYHIKTLKWTTSNLVDLLPSQGRPAKVKTSNSLNWQDNKFVKAEMELVQEENGLAYNLAWEGDSLSKRTLTGNAHVKQAGEGDIHMDGKAVLGWEGKTAELSVVSDTSTAQNSLHLHGKDHRQKPFDLQLKTKNVDKPGLEGHGMHTEASLAYDGSKLNGHAHVELFKDHPHVDLVLVTAAGKNQFLWKLDRKSERHFLGEAAVKWTANNGGYVTSKSEFNFESPDSFVVKAFSDSDVLKINKLSVDASINSEKNQVQFNIKTADKELASGSANYKTATEGTKTSVEGTGNVKIDGTSYPLNYKGYCDFQTNVQECNFNAKSDKKTFSMKSKFSPTEYIVVRKICKDTGKCHEGKVISTVKHAGGLQLEHNVDVVMDLSLWNPEFHDLKFSSVAKRDGLLYDQTVNMEWAPDGKLSLVTYVQPTKVGTTLTLPKRTIAAEASYSLPKKDKKAVRAEASVWLDKSRVPNKRLHLLASGEFNQAKDTYNLLGELKANHPGLSRPLSVKGKASVSEKLSGDVVLEVDVFSTPQQALTARWKLVTRKQDKGYEALAYASLKSDGLKVNTVYESKLVLSKSSSFSYNEKLTYLTHKGTTKELVAKLELAPKKVQLVLKSPDSTLVDVLGKVDYSDSGVVFHANYNVLGTKYNEVLELKKPVQYKYKFTFGPKCGNKLFTSEGGIEMGKAVSSGASFSGKSLVQLEASLNEESFLKPTFSYDNDLAKELIKCSEEEVKYLAELVAGASKQMSEAATDEVKARAAQLVEALPQHAPLTKYWSDQASQLKEELVSDQTFQDAIHNLKEILNPIVEQLVIYMEEFSKFFTTVLNELKNLTESVQKSMEQLMPKLQESFFQLVNVASHLLEDGVKFIVDMVTVVFDQIVAHEADIMDVLKTLADGFQELGKVVSNFSQQIYGVLKEFLDSAMAELKDLPVAEMLNEQYEQFKELLVGDQVWDGALRELLSYTSMVLSETKQYLPTPELQQFIQTLINWLDKVAAKESVNHQEYAKKAAEELVGAVKPLFTTFYEQLTASEATLTKGVVTPYTAKFPLTRYPPGSLKISVVSWLLSKDLPSLKDVVRTYWPPFNPVDWVPPYRGRAYVMSSELVTFDGEHVSVNCDCQVVLTEDYVDGNFSLVGTFSGGKLQALQIQDHHDTVELRHAQKPLVNGKEVEFPHKVGSVAVWKRPTTVGVRTSGLEVLCTPDCKRCKISVSGFYFGRLRGLLGTLNNELYDELTLPDGKVGSKSSCVQAWAVGGKCSNCKEAEAPRDSVCTEMFTQKHELSLCYHLVNTAPWRKSCDQLASKASDDKQKKDAACTVAFAYASHCRNLAPVGVPVSCMTCDAAELGKLSLGKTAAMKPPYTKADVVFIVEQDHENKEVFQQLIVPLVASLKKELAANSVTDVKFGLVGFGSEKLPWPAYQTLGGQVMADNINVDLPFGAQKPSSSTGTIEMTYNFWKNLIMVQAGVTEKAMSYVDTLESFSWRPNALKTVVGVHSAHCLQTHVFTLLQHAYFIGNYKNDHVVYNVITYVGDLELPAGKNPANVVGFDLDHVYMLGDKEMKGEEVSQLKRAYDPCHTFSRFTGGTVFVAENFAKASDKKGFEGQVAKGLTNSLLANKNKELTCSCTARFNPYDGVYQKTECSYLPF